MTVMSSLKRTVVITGGSSGLGYYVALHVARQRTDFQVVIASRSDPDTAAMNRQLGQSNIAYLPLDLSSTANVRAFAATYAARGYPPLAALVLNAALQFPGGLVLSKEGVEMTFAVAHVGHALLFYLLRPYFAATARVVIVASGVHDPAKKSGLPDAVYNSAEELAHPDPKTAHPLGRQRYASAKLANVLWCYALDRRLRALHGTKDWTVTAICPGFMPGTGLARDAGPFLRFMWLHVLPHCMWLIRRFVFDNSLTPEQSAANVSRLAIGKEVEGVSGKYFEKTAEAKTSIDSYVVKKQEDLWKWTAKYVAKDEEEAREFESF